MTAVNNTSIAIIGGGPAGLMAAEAASRGGVRVDLYDSMASVGRKFLLAGKGGLNLTHAEPLEDFLSRYGDRRPQLEPLLAEFGPDALRDWAWDLGVATFVGSSCRVFPVSQKAAPLLRTWLRRLREAGVNFHMHHRWQGWDDNADLVFETPQGPRSLQADAVVLALGGGSWAKLGSDGAWVPLLMSKGIAVAPLKPSNCGFDCVWSEHFRQHFAGSPVKTVTATVRDRHGLEVRRAGEFIITETGVEGSLIYAVSADLRDSIAANGFADLWIDLAPGREEQRLAEGLAAPRGSASQAKHCKRQAGIEGVKTGLLRELATAEDFADPVRLAAAIKSLRLRLDTPRPLDEAISSAGGVAFEALDSQLMIRDLPGIFCAGEMLDWEGPTGGYLLTASFASGKVAGEGALAWLNRAQ